MDTLIDLILLVSLGIFFYLLDRWLRIIIKLKKQSKEFEIKMKEAKKLMEDIGDSNGRRN